MGNANWCKVGDHPYPEDQPGATTLAIGHQVKNQWGGYQPSNLTRTVCAACAEDIGIRMLGVTDEMSDDDLLKYARLQRARSGGKSMLPVAPALKEPDIPPSNRKDGKYLVDAATYVGYMQYLENPEDIHG